MNDYEMYSSEYRQMQRERRRRIAIRQRLTFAVILLILITFIIGFLTVAAEARKFEEGQKVLVYTANATEAQEQPLNVPDEALQQALYNIPLEGSLQRHIFSLCEQYDIDTALALAVCWQENHDWKTNAIGDGGDSFGLMQIQPKWNGERMERLGVTDLLDPYQNTAVGIDLLSEYIVKYGDIEKALICYNAGEPTAFSNWFDKGIYSNEYSQEVLAMAERLRGE